MKSAEFLATQLGLSYNQNEYGKANYHYCWATSPILLGYYVDSELKTYRCTTTVSNEKYSIGNLQDVTYDSYLNIPFFSKNIFSDDKCLTCSLGGFCGGGCILEIEYRGDLVCLYEKNSFEDFIEQIFKPQLKALYERNLF